MTKQYIKYFLLQSAWINCYHKSDLANRLYLETHIRETYYNNTILFLALNLKEIPYDIKPVSLIKGGGEQHSNEFREINPMEQVPSLQIDGHTLIESVSMI